MAHNPSAPARVAENARPATPVRLAGLGNRFVELLGRRLSREDFAAEVAALLSEAVRVRAVAVLVYDRRRERLALFSDQGLHDDARAALGAGADCPWDIPLRGLHNRRISVIEAAQQNPFVPKALASISPMALCIASLPIYYDYEPTAVVLLFGAGNRSFPDGQLLTLSQALRACARGLRDPSAPVVRAPLIDPEEETASGAAAAEGAASGPPAAVPEHGEAVDARALHLVGSERRVGAPPPERASTDLAARVAQLERELAQAQEQIERTAQGARGLTISRQAVLRERDSLADQLSEQQRLRETEASELRAQVTSLEERLLAADSERARNQRASQARHTAEQQAIKAVQAERDDLQERLRTADARTAELQATLAAAHAERDRLVTQVEALTRQAHAGQETLEAAQVRHGQERGTLEAERDAWKEQTAALQAQLKQRGEDVAGLERNLRAALAERDAAASALQTAREQFDRLAAAAPELERRVTEAEGARSATASDLAALQQLLDAERSAREQNEGKLRDQLAGVQADAERQSARAAALAAEVADREGQLTQLRQAQEAARQTEERRSATLHEQAATLDARLQQSAAEVQHLREQQANALQSEQALRDQLAGVQADAERQSARAAALAAEVADREGQLTLLRQAQETARQAEEGWQRGLAALRTELATLAAQLEQSTAEARQLRDERTTLRAALTEMRQRISDAETGHQTALGELQAKEADLRRQVDALTSERASLASRLQRAVENGQAATRRVQETQQRAEEIAETLRQRDAVLETAVAERDGLRAQVEALTRELQANREALAQATAQATDERAALEADRDRWKQQASQLRAEASQRDKKLAGLERDLERTVAAREAETNELEAARVQLEGLAARHAALEQTAREVEAARMAALAHGATLGETLDAERAARAHTERALRGDLVAARADAEQVSATNATLRDELQAHAQAVAERDAHIAGLRSQLEALREDGAAHSNLTEQVGALRARIAELEHARSAAEDRRAVLDAELVQARDEIEALRHHSADRGALVHRASELAGKIVELEQQLAAARAAVTAAEGHAAAAAAALDGARQQQAAAAMAADQQLAELRAALERMTAERAQAETEKTAQLAEMAAQRGALADLQAALDESRGAHARARDAGQDTARRLAETHRRMEELGALLRQRDAAIETATAERQRLTTELSKLAAQLRARQEMLESAEGRSALERLSLEADRDAWKEQAAVARAEQDRLASLVDELQQTATQVDAARAAAVAEATSLQRSLDAARGSQQQTEQALRADVAALQADADRLSSDAAALHGELAARDQQLAALRREQEAARQAEAGWQQTAAALRAEIAGLGVRLQESTVERQQLHDERAATERQLALLMASRGDEEQALVQGLQAAREQVAQLEEERATARAALTEARRQASQADAAHTAALAQLQAETTELRAQVAALAATRAELAEQVQQAQEALAAQVAQNDGESRQAQELRERCAQLEQSLAAVDAQRSALDRECTAARSEVERLRKSKSERGAQTRQASELGAKVAALEQQLAAVQADGERQRLLLVDELEAARGLQRQAEGAGQREQTRLQEALQQQIEERQRLEAETAEQLAALAQQAEAARQLQRQAEAAAEREQAVLREALQRQTDERRRLEAETAERVAAMEAQRAALAELQATLEQVRADRDTVAADGQAAARRLAAAEQQIAELTELIRQNDAAIQAGASAQSRLEEAARVAAAKAAELILERDEMRRKAQDAAERLKHERLSHSYAMAASARESGTFTDSSVQGATQAPPPPADVQPLPRPAATLVIERSAPLGAAVEAATEPIDAATADSLATPHEDALEPTGELVLLDEGPLREQACAALKEAGFEVTPMTLAEATGDELARRQLKCIMLNLGGGPEAWRTLRALRAQATTRAVPILAYVMTPQAATGFCFGRADFALWPLDASQLIERLGHLRPKLRRLLALSTDVDGLGRIREPLSQANISTSVVLDGKQALEFASMVDPEAALLQLSPACPSVARALVGFRASESTRDLPLLVVMDEASAANEEAFLATVTRQLLVKATFQFAGLPEEIARLIG
jgi:chromosome segregation ATPase